MNSQEPQNSAPEAQPQPITEPPAEPTGSGPFWGTGRRKSAVARVRLVAGSGRFMVNKREVDTYFTEVFERTSVREPLSRVNAGSRFDVFVNVAGGGHAGQAGAVRLGVARALVRADKRYEPTLREHNMLTRDSRVVERKKYGQRKARRRFQFSKR